jgi:hypothetical protein
MLNQQNFKPKLLWDIFCFFIKFRSCYFNFYLTTSQDFILQNFIYARVHRTICKDFDTSNHAI